MSIKFHRLSVGASDKAGFGSGSTWIIGGSIFLCAFSLTMFSGFDTSKLVLILNFPLLILFYLTHNFYKLHYVLGLFFGVLGTYYLVIATPDFFSTNQSLSSQSVYHYAVGIYYVGVAFFQYKVISKKL